MSLDCALEQVPPRRRSAESAERNAAHRSSNEQLTAARSVTREAGAPLDASTQRTMGERFDHDFSGVRVHSDSRAADSARSFDSLAYSSGPHVVFGEGQYSPGTPGGDRLLAHELAHVVQQDGADSHSGERQSAGTPTLEHEADHAAESVASGGPATIGHRAASPTVLRQAVPGPAQANPAPAGPEAAPAPKKPEHQEWKDVGRRGNVDAELNRKSGWLKVKMRVKFVKDNSLDPWPADDTKWNTFQSEFCKKVSKRWSTKHFLVPKTPPCPDEPARTVVSLNVSPVTTGEQAVANVKYTSDNPTSSVERGQSVAHLDIQDTKKRSDYPQTPAEHEFGHLLGLRHIHCDGGDEKNCYGETRDEKADIMGEGSFVSPRDYEVFAEIMSTITGCAYGVQQASFIPPSNAGAIGALVGAGLLGAAGVGIGMALGGPLGAFIGGAIGIIGGAIAGYFIGKAAEKPGDVPA
jgi:hypothetical protein